MRISLYHLYSDDDMTKKSKITAVLTTFLMEALLMNHQNIVPTKENSVGSCNFRCFAFLAKTSVDLIRDFWSFWERTRQGEHFYVNKWNFEMLKSSSNIGYSSLEPLLYSLMQKRFFCNNFRFLRNY